MNIEESLAKIWGSKWCATGSHFYTILLGIINGLIIYCFFTIFILTIAPAKELTDIYLLGIIGLSSIRIRFSGDEQKGIPILANVICFSMSFHDSRQFIFRCTNSSRNIVTTIETVNDNIAGSVSAIDIREGSAFDICHTGATEDSVQVAFSDRNSGTTTRITRITATIDMSTYDNLCLHESCRQT